VVPLVTITDGDIQGTCDPDFRGVRDEFLRNFTERDDVGAAVSVTVDGETVIDLWAGHADADRSRPWGRDTLVPVYSTTKGLTALCAHMLVDRGLLDVDERVASYWPEFAQAGKESIPVRWLLTHRAGLTGPGERLTRAEVRDWDRICSALAATTPWWEPNTMSGYHALTFGFLVGEVVRRISGRSLGTFLREEVAGPLGADLYVGVPESELGRCADMIPGTPPDLVGAVRSGGSGQEVHPGLKALNNCPMGDVNDPLTRMAEMPAANGHVTARGIATVYGALANGGAIGDTRLVSPEAIDRMREPQPAMPDLLLSQLTGGDFQWGLGFMLNQLGASGPNPRSFGHGGAGGSYAFADPENRVTYAYVMNRMSGGTMGEDMRSVSLVGALYRDLGR
jgi:CubicO group peptidase (beta-lactamase class C family)